MTAACRSLLLLVAFTTSALAQSPSATELFKQGRALAKAGKDAEACDKFKKSQELDPQLGTLFNIAQCEEKIGQLASAIAAYREVVAKDTNAERRARAAEFQSKLEQRVPKLLVIVSKPPASLVVTLDGPRGAKPIEPNSPIEVDLGEYSVVARADGYRELSSKVKIDTEGKTTTVPIDLALVHGRDDDVVAAEPHHPQPPPPEQPAPSHSHRKTYGYVALGVGGVALAAGLYFGSVASGKWNDAKAVCGGTTCTTQSDVDKAQALVDDSRSAGNISTALVVGGAAIAATGVVLWLTAPSEEHAVRVSATPTSVSIFGRF
jgi:tetratricopeptide (TPR) repeat protein